MLAGPYGVIVAEGVAIFFLWRLFREASAEARKSQDNTGALTSAVTGLASEFKEWRESWRDYMMERARPS